MSERQMTWTDAARAFPHFVQWIVQRYGPLPDGPMLPEDYERFKTAYEGDAVVAAAIGDTG